MGKTKCRRCSECINQSHHWLADPLSPEDEDWEPGDYACKHCEQRGKECPTCYGNGVVVNGDDEVFCPTCSGEGVVSLSEHEYDHEMNLRFGDPDGGIASKFAYLSELPSDMADAYESFKLSILRHKLAGWQECSITDALSSLALLTELTKRVDGPFDDTTPTSERT